MQSKTDQILQDYEDTKAQLTEALKINEQLDLDTKRHLERIDSL